MNNAFGSTRNTNITNIIYHLINDVKSSTIHADPRIVCVELTGDVFSRRNKFFFVKTDPFNGGLVVIIPYRIQPYKQLQ